MILRKLKPGDDLLGRHNFLFLLTLVGTFVVLCFVCEKKTKSHPIPKHTAVASTQVKLLHRKPLTWAQASDGDQIDVLLVANSHSRVIPGEKKGDFNESGGDRAMVYLLHESLPRQGREGVSLELSYPNFTPVEMLSTALWLEYKGYCRR